MVWGGGGGRGVRMKGCWVEVVVEEEEEEGGGGGTRLTLGA